MSRSLDTSQTFAPAEFAHFVVNTAQLATMRDWYAKVLGMKVVIEAGPLCFMSYDGEHHRLALLNDPNLAKGANNTVGINHLAYTMVDLGALLATYKRLKDDDILPWWCINHGPTTSMYYRDPDGNNIELQVDNFSKEKAKAWMTSSAFQDNPLGIDYDPDLLAQRYQAGDPMDSLLAQGSAPRDSGVSP